MHPYAALTTGREILSPLLTGAGFLFAAEQTGTGSGGAFASGEFVRDDRRLQLHFRASLGMVTYHVGEHFLSHDVYMRALGVPQGAASYPGYSSEPLDGFRHLLADIRAYAMEFVDGDARVLIAYAPIDAEERARAWRIEQASYMGDQAKRSAAQAHFRRGEYSHVVALLDSLQDPALLSPSERRALDLARQRAEPTDISRNVV